MKKALKATVVSLLLLVLFRGFLYRWLIRYTEVGTRSEIKITDSKLLNRIANAAADKQLNLKEIVRISDEITNAELEFTSGKASGNPNELIHSKQANCVGYSAMFNAVANHLIEKSKMQNEIEAKQKIGKLDFIGIDLHQFFKSSFFKDHDFNEVKNTRTGEVICIDPTVSDYLWVRKITKRQKEK